ncbi:MAG: urate oxidase [Chloroflexota bacterium]|nr:urate oxidase [Chloroflexota bacterium]
MIELGPNRYGKSGIRLVKVIRGPDRHQVRDLTVAIALEGDFEAAHVDGDNSAVVATDTMKNTVYALAGEHLAGSVEQFGLVLARHFLAFDQVSKATVAIDEHRWVRMPTDNGEAPDAFLRSGDYTRTAVVSATEAGLSIEAGIRDLAVMKTGRSGFAGFPRDQYTTLPEVDDRIMATMLTASWRYGEAVHGIEFDGLFDAIGETLLDAFADHDSPSVQASIWIVGRAVLEAHGEVDEIRMTLPNLHHWQVDLSPFGLPNDRQIFVATQEPYGLIEATVRRGD